MKKTGHIFVMLTSIFAGLWASLKLLVIHSQWSYGSTTFSWVDFTWPLVTLAVAIPSMLLVPKHNADRKPGELPKSGKPTV